MAKHDKSEVEKRKSLIIGLLKDFCNQRLDNDYFELAIKVIEKLGRKREIPFMTGKVEIWAAAIVHALGTVNFLFDKSFKPYITVNEINDFFGTKTSTTGNKSKEIRELLKMSSFNNEYLTQQSIDNHPMNNLVSVNGFIVHVDSLPEDMRDIVRQAKKGGGGMELTIQRE